MGVVEVIATLASIILLVCTLPFSLCFAFKVSNLLVFHPALSLFRPIIAKFSLEGVIIAVFSFLALLFYFESAVSLCF